MVLGRLEHQGQRASGAGLLLDVQRELMSRGPVETDHVLLCGQCSKLQNESCPSGTCRQEGLEPRVANVRCAPLKTGKSDPEDKDSSEAEGAAAAPMGPGAEP